jgi:hypothetical protein
MYVAKGMACGVERMLLAFSLFFFDAGIFIMFLECLQLERPCRALHCLWILIWNCGKRGAFLTTCCLCGLIECESI